MESNLYPSFPILIVDDEKHLLNSYEMTLNYTGINNIILCNDSRNVYSTIADYPVRLVLLDLSMPFISGEELLEKLKEEYPDITVIIITGNNDIHTAVKCMKRGAADYLVKPIEENRLVSSVKNAIEIQELQRQNYLLKERILTNKLEHPEIFSEIVTQNEKMKSMFQYMEAISKTSEPVLITGETGVGKELVAKAMHDLTGRNGKFVTTNVGGLDDQMFTDTLFGHKKGAFTGADKDRSGLIEKAAGGTLFLDEIGDLSIASQVKLLRLLQEHEYYPLGTDEPRYSEALIIVSTNVDLFKLKDEGKFRKDLFYRLNVHNIQPVPLRERFDDLPLLLDYFLNEAAQKMGKPKPTPPPELITLLSLYRFPGNIRELKAMVFDAVSTHKSKILSMESFKQAIEKNKRGEIPAAADKDSTGQAYLEFHGQLPTLKEAQKLLIDEAMKRANNNQSLAAQILGISRQALNQRLKSF